MITAHRCFRSTPQRALVNVKLIEIANQVGVVYHSQMHSMSSDANYLNFFLKYGHFEREREREREREM